MMEITLTILDTLSTPDSEFDFRQLGTPVVSNLRIDAGLLGDVDRPGIVKFIILPSTDTAPTTEAELTDDIDFLNVNSDWSFSESLNSFVPGDYVFYYMTRDSRLQNPSTISSFAFEVS